MQAITAFDAAIILIVGLSAIFAFSRGFATVALSFGAWAGAFVATGFGFQMARPWGRQYITPDELADILTLIAIFFVSLVILKTIAGWLGRTVKESPVGFLDRSLGALFGLARGVVIVSVAYLAFSKLYPGNDTPEWVEDAKLRPLVAWSAEMVEGFAISALGKDPTSTGSDYMAKARDATVNQFINEELEKAVPEYSKKARKGLDNLLDDVAQEVAKQTAEKDGDSR